MGLVAEVTTEGSAWRCNRAQPSSTGQGGDRYGGTARGRACLALGTHKATEAENARSRPGFSRGFLFLLAFEFLYVLYRFGLTVLRKKTGLFSVHGAHSLKKKLFSQ